MSKSDYPFDQSGMIFVFGSNTAGIHGGGAARHAHQNLGAVWGVSYGLTGLTFAIPTKGHKQVESHPRDPEVRSKPTKLVNVVGDTLPLPMIRRYIDGFLAFAAHHPELHFKVTCIGCGLAGLKHEDVAPLFNGFTYLPNIWFDRKWEPYFTGRAKFWGEG